MTAPERVTAAELQEALSLVPETVGANAWFSEFGHRLAREVAALRAERDDARGDNARARAFIAAIGGELADASTLLAWFERAKAEATALGDAISEAGIDTHGPNDDLVARLGRLLVDANEQSAMLEALRERARAVLAILDRLKSYEAAPGEVLAFANARIALRVEVEKP